MIRKDLTGQRFGQLQVLGLDHAINGAVFWKCKCDCGNDRIIRANSLMTGNSSSCGCLQRKRATHANTTHGGASRRKGEHPLYQTWANMRARCEKPYNNRYETYGARGIKVCERWKSFENFRNDMEPTWKPHLSVERINNDGHYCPENCRWATDHEQARNTRSNRWIEFNGKRMILADWAKETGISHSLISYRLKVGWTIADALTTPSRLDNPTV